jgi:pyruvate ferredoxin oxidoreductase alpha subunit
VARAVTLCRPQVVAAYPISPQTHIVESLSDRVRTGELAGCEYLMVESEFGAMSACIGASAAGARTYTATSSQGLLFMAEALFNASGLGLPIVMTVANRAIGAPINIWNDHSDTMAMRDSGWIQLFAATNQEAADLHLQAYVVAEELSVPVMVCMDGFVLTHAFEEVDLPTQEQVDAYLPAFSPRQVLDPEEPVTIGAMVGPDAFTEVKYLMHTTQVAALDVVERVSTEFRQAFGRRSGGLVRPYRLEGAETVVVALGSVLGTLEEDLDDLREAGVAVGLLGNGCFRPWPAAEVRAALAGARRVVVLERAFSVGAGGIVGQNVRDATRGLPAEVYDVVAGLGGRPVTRASVRALLDDVLGDRLDPHELHFLDLHQDVVARELARRSP